MKQILKFYDREANKDVCGETAAFGNADRLIDLAVTPLNDGGVEFDVLDGAEIAWRGYSENIASAKSEAVAIARRMFFQAV